MIVHKQFIVVTKNSDSYSKSSVVFIAFFSCLSAVFSGFHWFSLVFSLAFIGFPLVFYWCFVGSLWLPFVFHVCSVVFISFSLVFA